VCRRLPTNEYLSATACEIMEFVLIVGIRDVREYVEARLVFALNALVDNHFGGKKHALTTATPSPCHTHRVTWVVIGRQRLFSNTSRIRNYLSTSSPSRTPDLIYRTSYKVRTSEGMLRQSACLARPYHAGQQAKKKKLPRMGCGIVFVPKKRGNVHA
jgi:hypothetical protein